MSRRRNRIGGALAPVLTPFDEDREPDFPAFLAHCRWLLDNGVGLAIFGTNSEAASLSTDERIALTDGLIEAGIPSDRLMPGTGACSVKDAVRLTRHAVQSGAAGVLMLPPFYFKNVSEEGVFSYYAEVIDAVARRLRRLVGRQDEQQEHHRRPDADGERRLRPVRRCAAIPTPPAPVAGLRPDDERILVHAVHVGRTA